MSHISSINFKKSKDYQVFHNTNIRPNYTIGGELSYTLKGYEALKLKNQIIENAKEQYTKRTGQKFQAKSFEWSAVCNIKPDTTMQDLEKLAEHFNHKYGFQCYQIAIHRDEGHINEKGEKVINHHAHMEFITLDKTTGKNNYRRELITPKVLRQIQTEVAEILQMQRGQDKRLTGVKRIEPRKYAAMKEQEKRNTKELKQALLSQKDFKSQIEAFRKECIGKGYPKEFFRDLSTLKQSEVEITKELLKTTLEDLAKGYEENNQVNKELKTEIYSLKNELNPQFNTISIPQTYKTKLIDEVYTDLSKKIDLKPYFFDKERKEFINQKLDFKVQDKGNSIVLNSKNNENMSEKVKLMLEMAITKGWNLDKIEINGSDKFKAEVHKQISEIQKTKINSLENDLKAEKEKNDKLIKQISKMDLKGNFEPLNDTNKNKENRSNYSEDVIKACYLAANEAYKKIYELDKSYYAKNNHNALEVIKYLNSAVDFERKLKELKETSKEKFAEWKQNNPNYKEILDKYYNNKNKYKIPTKIKEQTKTKQQGQELTI